MESGLIFVKTPKGTAEIAARGGALSLAARRVLIMIDGKRTVADLAPLLRPGEIDGVIGTLESMGFIQRAGGETPRAAEAPRGAEAPAPAAEERSTLSVEELKHRAVRELNDRLGPDAEVMAIRIEQARTPEELRERLREAERLVSGLLGEPVAQEFLRALRRR
ncbi:MAG TPA: hypothetical protein VFR86_18805 [Burkholderiaceae bacterium]|nr:hypothetical protein [Burkholderiaceae bacterium]